MTDGLVTNYFRLWSRIRSTELDSFCQEHDRLYRDACRSGDYGPVTRAWYGSMAPLISAAYGPSWHFVPPDRRGQQRDEAQRRLHEHLAEVLQLEQGKHALDIGCGVGGAMRNIARSSGANVAGIALGDDEIELNNRICADEAIEDLCRAKRGDALDMPFDDESFDAAYAIYALKYFPDPSMVLAEVARTLRPGGLFASYDLLRSDRFDESNPEHAQLVGRFEYATAMPPLATKQRLREQAERVGLELVRDGQFEGNLPWYQCFVENPLLPWLVQSKAMRRFVHTAEKMRLLPRGFARFEETFISGNVSAIIEAGRSGLLDGASLMLWRKS
jgi:sterol 24-C-methyltransferase